MEWCTHVFPVLNDIACTFVFNRARRGAVIRLQTVVSRWSGTMAAGDEELQLDYISTTAKNVNTYAMISP